MTLGVEVLYPFHGAQTRVSSILEPEPEKEGV
jgi:hypothetical protein